MGDGTSAKARALLSPEPQCGPTEVAAAPCPVHQLFAPTQLSAPRVTHGASGSLGWPPADPSLQ